MEARVLQASSTDIQERALMKLQQLNAAGDLKDLSIRASIDSSY